VFTQQTGYPKSEGFFSNLNNVVSSTNENVNLHLEIDGSPWEVEILRPQRFDEHYWMANPERKQLIICGIADVASVKYDCWMQYHRQP